MGPNSIHKTIRPFPAAATAIFAAVLVMLCIPSPLIAQQTHNKGMGYNEYACGPVVLGIILDRMGKHETYPELFKLSATENFLTTLEGMKQALAAKGVHAQYYKGAMSDLQGLSRGRMLICHTKRNHYVLITRMDANWIYLIDTYMGRDEIRMPHSVFSYLWDGVVLAVDASSAVQPVQLAALSREEAAKITGSQANCENTPKENKKRREKNKKENTKEPVNTTTGNFFTEMTDLALPGRGIPFVLDRTYNAQTVSTVEGWSPEPGAGSWVIEDGELSGEGDRYQWNTTWSAVEWSNSTNTMDIKTVTPGENYCFEVARINFCYTDENNRYYVLLDTNGRLELTKYQTGHQYFLASAATSLDPRKWNKFEIHTRHENDKMLIRVIVNDVLYIAHIDENHLSTGKFVLESYFCHAHYDNIYLRGDINPTIYYNFDVDDNDLIFGYGWTSLLDYSIRELVNGDCIVYQEDGSSETYTRLGDGTYSAPRGIYDKLTKDTGGYTLQLVKANLFYRFDTSGKIVSIRDRNNNTIQFQHSQIQVGTQGQQAPGKAQNGSTNPPQNPCNDNGNGGSTPKKMRVIISRPLPAYTVRQQQAIPIGTAGKTE